METSDLLTQFKPVQSIIIYKNTSTDTWSKSEYYLESRNILKSEKGDFQFSEGKPLEKRTLAGLSKSLAQETTAQYKFKELIPKTLLYFDKKATGNRLIWYVPIKAQHFFFTPALQLPEGKAFIPLLIFEVNKNELFVYATKTKQKPTLQTKLYNAPFHNIYTNGKVCLGNGKRVKKNDNYYEEVMQSWEKLFWSTAFSHLNNNPIKGNLNMLYKKLINTEKPFPKEVLKPAPFKNLKALIEQSNS